MGNLLLPLFRQAQLMQEYWDGIRMGVYDFVTPVFFIVDQQYLRSYFNFSVLFVSAKNFSKP